MRGTCEDGNSISALRAIAEAFGSRMRKKRVYLEDGSVLTQSLRATFREHKIELLANDNLVLADVEARYGEFKLLKINERPSKYRFGNTAATISASAAEHTVRTIDGKLSRAQAELIASGVLSRLIERINLQTDEELNISQGLVRAYLRLATAERLMSFINAVMEVMPHEESGRYNEIKQLPEELQALIPLLPKWAIDDDEERTRKVRRCSPSTRQKLVDTVVPLLPEINQFLDGFGKNPPEAVCALGSLAQAAVEAQMLLASKQ